jgi:hypothetical protein
MVNTSGRMPRSSAAQITGAATGKPDSAGGEYGPVAVVPRPLRS